MEFNARAPPPDEAVQNLRNFANSSPTKIKSSASLSTDKSEQVASAIIRDMGVVQSYLHAPKTEIPRSIKELYFDGTICKVLQNYKLLQIESGKELKVAPDFDLLSNFFKVFLAGDYELIASTSPEMLSSVATVKEALVFSENQNVGEAKRAQYLPQSTGAGTENGVYFLKSFPQELDPIEVTPTFVAKPSVQEAGSAGNPHGHLQVSRNGIEHGEGAIRERLVYKGQQLLGIDCGIPQTCLISSNNFLLGSNTRDENVIKILKKLKALDYQFQPHTFVRLMAEFGSPEALVAHIEKTVTLYLNGIKDDEIRANQENQKKPLLFTLKEDIALLWSHFLKTSEKPEDVNCVSIQKFVKNSVPLPAAHGRAFKLPLEEYHKFFIDMIFFNTDRHVFNILFANKQFHLIDNGSCLPRPLQDAEGLKQARFEFLQLDSGFHQDFQPFSKPLHEPYAKIIANLDIDAFINELKKDQDLQAKRFGQACSIPKECYDLLRFNLHLLKVGVSVGANFKDICLFQSVLRIQEKEYGGEIVNFFRTYMNGEKSIDWTEIDREIALVLKKNMEDRVKSW